MLSFLSGALTAGYLVVGLLFLRFWQRTRDRLFVMFAIAFWLLATNQAVIAIGAIDREDASWVYLLRAAAFSLIIIAILAKNLPARRR
jgi:uncharacterized membrane protein HdeD (DUF308 family)